MSEEAITLDSGDIVTLGPKLGEGAFGVVHQGFVEGKDDIIAVKLESRDRVRKCLGAEVSILHELQPLSCVPRLLGQGVAGQNSYMATEMLGESINDKFKRCGRVFSLGTVLMIAEKTIPILEAMHGFRYLHRDIKPHNFLTGHTHKSEIYIIDFGLSKKYSDSLEVRGNRGVSGTIPFVSLNIHLGSPASRRDDLEALGYMFVYLLKGSLPWFNHKQEKLTEFAVKRIKEETSLLSLCQGLPSEFEGFLRYVRSLRFEQDPDYKALKVAFRILARREGIAYDWKYDWVAHGAGDLRAARRQSAKSAKSTAGVSYTARVSSTESRPDEEQPSSPELPATPKQQPSLDAALFRSYRCKTDLMTDSFTPVITLSLTKSVPEKPKKSRKFTGLAKLKSEVLASKGKLTTCNGAN